MLWWHTKFNGLWDNELVREGLNSPDDLTRELAKRLDSRMDLEHALTVVKAQRQHGGAHHDT